MNIPDLKDWPDGATHWGPRCRGLADLVWTEGFYEHLPNGAWRFYTKDRGWDRPFSVDEDKDFSELRIEQLIPRPEAAPKEDIKSRWIQWPGESQCPVDPNCRVDVRSGKVTAKGMLASLVSWQLVSEYRLSESHPEREKDNAPRIRPGETPWGSTTHKAVVQAERNRAFRHLCDTLNNPPIIIITQYRDQIGTAHNGLWFDGEVAFEGKHLLVIRDERGDEHCQEIGQWDKRELYTGRVDHGTGRAD